MHHHPAFSVHALTIRRKVQFWRNITRKFDTKFLTTYLISTYYSAVEQIELFHIFLCKSYWLTFTKIFLHTPSLLAYYAWVKTSLKFLWRTHKVVYVGMFTLRILECKISKIGLRFQFNHDYNKVWYTVPGSMKSRRKKLPRHPPLTLMGIWDIDKGIEYLQSLPIRENTEVDFEDPFVIKQTWAVWSKRYPPHNGNKIIPHPKVEKPRRPLFKSQIIKPRHRKNDSGKLPQNWCFQCS